MILEKKEGSKAVGLKWHLESSEKNWEQFFPSPEYPSCSSTPGAVHQLLINPHVLGTFAPSPVFKEAVAVRNIIIDL